MFGAHSFNAGQSPVQHPFHSAFLSPFPQYPPFPDTSSMHGSSRPASAPATAQRNFSDVPQANSTMSAAKSPISTEVGAPAAKRTKAKRVYPNVKPFVGNLFNLCNDPECSSAIRYWLLLAACILIVC